jgi:hypothetical protein
LWEHEVVELFLLGPEARYTEIELGPAGHYLVLQLRGVRNVVASDAAIDFEAHVEGDRWRGRARVPRALLPEPVLSGNAHAIHGQGADRRYLSAFPADAERPDFHRLESFHPLLWGDASG